MKIQLFMEQILEGPWVSPCTPAFGHRRVSNRKKKKLGEIHVDVPEDLPQKPLLRLLQDVQA